MKLSQFDYTFPEELIAHDPLKNRDHSRLLVLRRDTGKITTTKHVFDLPSILRPTDLLVVNNSRVFPARLIGKKESGGEVEILLLSPESEDSRRWRAMATKLKRLKTGTVIDFAEGLSGIIEGIDSESVVISLNHPEQIDQIGLPPLPPYIVREQNAEATQSDRERYQTVYAKQTGSAAAPTAGLHFTPELIQKLHATGIEIAPVTLHVGRDTFLPVRVEDITTHKMHGEQVSISEESTEKINRAKTDGRRVIAVGTTSVRTLESAAQSGRVAAGSFVTHAFIYPGYKFQIIDGMMTNFHQPKSTLMMLVSAFAGIDTIRAAYAQAIIERFRLFSYGDTMIIL